MLKRHIMLLSGGLDSTYLLFKLLREIEFNNNEELLILYNSSVNYNNNDRQRHSVFTLLKFLDNRIPKGNIKFTEVSIDIGFIKNTPVTFNNIQTNVPIPSWSGYSQIPLLLSTMLSGVHAYNCSNVLHFSYVKDDFCTNDRHDVDINRYLHFQEYFENMKNFIDVDNCSKIDISFDLKDMTKREVISNLIDMLNEYFNSSDDISFVLKNIIYCESNIDCDIENDKDECLCRSCKLMKYKINHMINDKETSIIKKYLLDNLIDHKTLNPLSGVCWNMSEYMKEESKV